MIPSTGNLELEKQGIKNPRQIFRNLTTPALYEHAIRRGEGSLSNLGPLVVSTGQHTGRAPNDKFIVREPTSQENIWWGKVNRDFPGDKFDKLHQDLTA
ncbi:MAG: phosphoenolpyruvate carboxykinase (ATP), partial [Desulfobacterales bacterium]